MKTSKIFLSLVLIGWIIPLWLYLDSITVTLKQLADQFILNSLGNLVFEPMLFKIGLLWLAISMLCVFWKK